MKDTWLADDHDAGIMVISETADINEVKLGDELIWVYNVAERQVSFIVDLGVRTCPS